MTLGQWYRLAQRSRNCFRQLAETVALCYGAELHSRATLKNPARVLQKMAEDQVGPDRIWDVDGHSLIVTSPNQAYLCLEGIRTMANVVRVKDRLLTPTEAGYRDILINIRMPNGFIGEVLVIPAPMFVAKGPGHKLYELYRSGLLTADDAAATLQAMRQLYDDAWATFLAGPSKEDL